MADPDTLNPPAPAGLSLRDFREWLRPQQPLSLVSENSGVDASSLSKYERGSLPMSGGAARLLSVYYSSIAGREVSAGEVMDMAEMCRLAPSPSPTEDTAAAAEGVGRG